MNRRYWVVRLGHGGKYASVLRNQLAIGWNDLGDLSWLFKSEEEPDFLYQELRTLYEGVYDGSFASIRTRSAEIMAFVHRITSGDLILTPIKRKVLIGEAGEYRFKSDWSDNCPYSHRRGIKWIGEVDRETLPETLKSSIGTPLTVYNVDKHSDIIESVLHEERPTTRQLPTYLETQLKQTSEIAFRDLNTGEFEEAERIFADQYESIRIEEQEIRPNERFHKGAILQNWGVALLLQKRTEEGIRKIILAFIEDLIGAEEFSHVWLSCTQDIAGAHTSRSHQG